MNNKTHRSGVIHVRLRLDKELDDIGMTGVGGKTEGTPSNLLKRQHTSSFGGGGKSKCTPSNLRDSTQRCGVLVAHGTAI